MRQIGVGVATLEFMSVLSTLEHDTYNCRFIEELGNIKWHRARVEINKKLMRPKKIQKQKPLRLDLRVLEKNSHYLQSRTKKIDLTHERRKTISRENEQNSKRIYGHHKKQNAKVHNEEEY